MLERMTIDRHELASSLGCTVGRRQAGATLYLHHVLRRATSQAAHAHGVCFLAVADRYYGDGASGRTTLAPTLYLPSRFLNSAVSAGTILNKSPTMP